MSAETELNAVKKIEANKYCVNCDAYNKFGHGNICEKFRTFVCSNCKSAHQSFSMRVKSVSMSNWSKEEVDALREENGGGNAVAKRVWLGKWDDAQMRKPTDKDHVDYFKKFINRVYNDRAFYDDSPAAAAPSSEAPLSRKGSMNQRRASSPPPAANANLLDFSASSAPAAAAASTFDAFASPPAAASTSPSSDGWGAFASAPAPVASSNDGFGDFASFSSAPPAPVAAAAAPSAQSFDPFGVSAQPPAAQSAFDPFGVSAQTVTPAPVQPVSFDPFGASNASVLQPTVGFGTLGSAPAPAPSGPPPGKNFSAFDELSSPNLAYGGGYTQPHQGHHYGHHQGHHQSRHHGHHHAGVNGNGFQQQQMGYQPQMAMGGGGFGVVNPAANISAFMAPNAAHHSGVGIVGGGYTRQAPAGGRDPFAGLGLPQH